MLGVFGVGRVLNAKIARSQLVGGMIMGVGSGLGEESVVDLRDGSFVNRDLAEYHVPVNADIGEIDAIVLDETEDKMNPIGIKGLVRSHRRRGSRGGECVFNATNIRGARVSGHARQAPAGLRPQASGPMDHGANYRVFIGLGRAYRGTTNLDGHALKGSNHAPPRRIAVTSGPNKADLLRAATNPISSCMLLSALRSGMIEAQIDAIEETGIDALTSRSGATWHQPIWRGGLYGDVQCEARTGRLALKRSSVLA